MAKVKVYYAGVDEWNRPVFKEIAGKRYYCDVFHLFDYNAPEEEVLKWYASAGTSAICYKGSRFDSEPEGDPADVEIVTRKEAKEMICKQ